MRANFNKESIFMTAYAQLASPSFVLSGSQTKHLTSALQVIGASLFLAVCAQIRIPLPFSPIPLTMQTFAIFLIGGYLGSKKGLLAVMLYLCEAAIGLPVLSGFRGSLLAFAGPTTGYLVGIAFQAYAIGYFVERTANLSVKKLLPVALLVTAIQLGLGACWLSYFVGASNALSMGVYPFIPGEILKILAVVPCLKKARNY